MNASEWISIDERLPAVGEIVLLGRRFGPDDHLYAAGWMDGTGVWYAAPNCEEFVGDNAPVLPIKQYTHWQAIAPPETDLERMAREALEEHRDGKTWRID